MTFSDHEVTVTSWRRGEEQWEWKARSNGSEAFFTVRWDFPSWALLAAGRRALGLPLSENAEDVLELAEQANQAEA